MVNLFSTGLRDAYQNFVLVNTKKNLLTPVRFIKFYLFDYFRMKRYSRSVSQKITQADKRFLGSQWTDYVHGVSELDGDRFTLFKNYFLEYFKEYLEKSVDLERQNIFPVSKLTNDPDFLGMFKNYVQRLREEKELPDLVQNAYFIKDIVNVRAPAHEFHRDGIGVRFKVWFVLDCNGEMGLDYVNTNFDANREYAMYKHVYISEKMDLEFKRQEAFPGQIYCMDTECIHRGYMGDFGNRTAIVVEFIDRKKFNDIEGKYDAFHGDAGLIELMK